MKTAEEIVKKLADWSKKYPRGRVYPMSKQTMDNELIEIENEAKEYASLKEDKWISVEELTELLKESKDVLVMCSLVDKSNTCDKMVKKIEEKLKSVFPSPPKTEKKMSEEKSNVILVGVPSVTMDKVIAELKLEGKNFIVVDPNNKEQMAEIAKMQNPAFEPPPMNLTNLRTEGLIEPLRGSNTQKKFRKQNNRKHKKSRR